MKIIRTDAISFGTMFQKIMNRGKTFDEELWMIVKDIVEKVALQGDSALFAYTEKFDGCTLTANNVAATDEEIRDAASNVKKKDLEILELAAARIENYHRKQVQQSWLFSEEPGIEIGQRILPLERVGIYAPAVLPPIPLRSSWPQSQQKLPASGTLSWHHPQKMVKYIPLLQQQRKSAG